METIKSMWDFFQNEILGMNWLNKIIKNLLESLGLDTSSRVGNSMLFFLYDTVKIMVLLGILVLLISYIQSYFPPERTKRILGGLHGIRANIIAALLGTVTPFCSCSSIPIFIGFTKCGTASWSYLLFSDLFSYGRSRITCAFNEYLWRKSSSRLCTSGTCHCSGRRHRD